MSRGLFDLIHAYNGQQPQGYAAFNPGFVGGDIGPEQAVALQARGNLMSQSGTGPSLAGNVLGSALGAGIKAGIGKLRSRSPSAKLGRAMANSIDGALNSKVARIMKSNPKVSARQAIVAAAEELYASTDGSKQDPAFRDAIRSRAMSALEGMGEFDPESQKKFAEARKANFEVDSDGSELTTLMHKPSRRMFSVPVNQAKAILGGEKGGDFLEMDKPPLSSINETNEILQGEEQITTRFDPATGGFPEIARGPASLAKGRTSLNINTDDNRTDSQLGETDKDLMNAFAGMQSINHAIDEIGKITKNAEAKGIEGTTGTVGGIYRFLGETTQVISAAAGIAKTVTEQNGGDSKVYNGGKMTYGELTDPGRYDSVFKNFQLGGQESKRIRASLINLAYMLAITEESSARAISDNDIKLRLQTLGADISAGKGLRQVLEDRRRNAMYNLKARLDNDKTYGSDPFYRQRFADLSKGYNLEDEKLIDPAAEAPMEGEPEVSIGANGQITVRNKKK